MISIIVNETEILQIPKIEIWQKRSVFALIYTIFISTLFATVLWIEDSTIFLISLMALFFGGCVFTIMFYYFARQTIIIKISNDEISVKEPFVKTRKREFQLEDYTKIALREDIGSRLQISWDCNLFVNRKYMSVYSGDKLTGELIANAIANKLELPFELTLYKKDQRRRVHNVISKIFPVSFAIPPLIIISNFINPIIITVLLILWILCLMISSITLVSKHYLLLGLLLLVCNRFYH